MPRADNSRALVAGGTIGAGAIASGAVLFDVTTLPTAHATRAQVFCIADDLAVVPGSGASGGLRIYDPDDTTKYAQMWVASSVLTLAATAPAAVAGASQVGIGASLTASAAVASTDTAGAAAGGSVTITAGAAARLTSGNADGGAINLTPGAGIGTGVTGEVVVGGAVTYTTVALPAAHASSAKVFSIGDDLAVLPGSGANGGLRIYDPDDTAKYMQAFVDGATYKVDTVAAVTAQSWRVGGTEVAFINSGLFYLVSAQLIFHTSGVGDRARLKATATDVLQCRSNDDGDYGTFDAIAYRASGTKVVGAQGAAVADVSAGAVTQTAAGATDCMDKINLILARLRAHGLIAT